MTSTNSMSSATGKTSFSVSIKERYRLNSPHSEKETYHVVLDLADHPFFYDVGDCIGIYPLNDPFYVKSILERIGATGLERIQDRDQNVHMLRDFLSSKANVGRASRRLLEFLNEKAPSAFLESLLLDKEGLKNYLESHDLLDVLLQIKEAEISPSELASFLSPLIPRFYSIASSQVAVGKELHLTVAVTRYQVSEKEKLGVCSHYLCHLAPLNEPVVSIFLQKARDFFLSPPSFERPLIMIGPGTGVAPFRGFLQERLARGSSAPNWLFFGERNRDQDFYYKDFFTSLVEQKKLRLDLAFSRDQGQKIYVQHRMLENAKDLWRWLQEGGFIYVCGDASRMAKDVDSALHTIIAQEGNFSEPEAKLYIKRLKQEGRYLRDVY